MRAAAIPTLIDRSDAPGTTEDYVENGVIAFDDTESFLANRVNIRPSARIIHVLGEDASTLSLVVGVRLWR